MENYHTNGYNSIDVDVKPPTPLDDSKRGLLDNPEFGAVIGETNADQSSNSFQSKSKKKKKKKKKVETTDEG